MNDIDYKDKVVFVAGGSSGINLAIAQAFAEQGAKLSIISRSQEKLDAALTQLLKSTESAIAESVDVRDYAAVEQALLNTKTQYGEIDILVSGAAGNFPAKSTAMSANAFKSVVDIDLLGGFNVLRAAYAVLKKPGAVVVNISAPQAFVPMRLQAHVCAAKSGLDMLTRVLAMEWGADGIRVNSIVPGPIAETEGMQRLAPTPEIRQSVADSVPLKRLGTKADIANAVLLLCSPYAGFIHGAILPVDGGWSLSGASESMAVLANMMG